MGKTVALDGRNGSHAYQVRFCTEVDLRVKLPNSIMVNHRRFHIVFKNSYIFLPPLPCPVCLPSGSKFGDPPNFPLVDVELDSLNVNLTSNFFPASDLNSNPTDLILGAIGNDKVSDQFSDKLGKILETSNHLMLNFNPADFSHPSSQNVSPIPLNLEKPLTTGNTSPSAHQEFITKSGKISSEPNNVDYSSPFNLLDSPAISVITTQNNITASKKSLPEIQSNSLNPLQLNSTPALLQQDLSFATDVQILLNLEPHSSPKHSSWPLIPLNKGFSPSSGKHPSPSSMTQLINLPSLVLTLSFEPCLDHLHAPLPRMINQLQPRNWFPLCPSPSQKTILREIYHALSLVRIEIYPQEALVNLKRVQILGKTLSLHPLLALVEATITCNLNLNLGNLLYQYLCLLDR